MTLVNFPTTLADLADHLATTVTDELVRRTAQTDTPPQDTTHHAPGHRELADRMLSALLDEYACRALTGAAAPLTEQDEAWVRARAMAQVCGLGPLDILLSEPGVRDIHINGTRVWVDLGDGRREERPPVTATDEELVALVQRLAGQAPGGERRFDLSAPLLSMELTDGARLSAVMGVSRRPAVTIRRHPEHELTLSDLVSSGMLTAPVRSLLTSAVRARLNLVIGGATGSGKTTLLRALARHIPHGERVITIEDAYELGLEGADDLDCLALQGRPPNTEGAGEVTLADLVRHALRMSPDRVIVGETRGQETVPLLHAMTMGNDGSMATVHASSSAQILTKLATYANQSSERLTLEESAILIASAVHLAVHIGTDADGKRQVSSIREIVGMDGPQVITNEIYSAELGGFVTPPSPHYARSLARVGFDPACLFEAQR
ncbi:CpaF family protein [Nocardiopsis sp. FIRDI 009]|uniref:CpaF family protein n=1 Tax=Nocardiopsis sp. FIRDI 009 TaxID=714197 RepID=UPI000E270F34|nr:ATPase, T2SS/T4P/T4SS family [Nocardiopsis sp. FIRDI 009]